jgi:hypothetical protein
MYPTTLPAASPWCISRSDDRRDQRLAVRRASILKAWILESLAVCAECFGLLILMIVSFRVHSWENVMTSSHGGNGQLDDGKPRLSEDDIARALLGPRGVPGKPDTAKMTPQQEKNMPKYLDPGHTS